MSKKCISTILIVCVFGMIFTGCAGKKCKFSHEQLAEYCKEQDIDESEDIEDYMSTAGAAYKTTEGYISCSGKDAQELYDELVNPVDRLPDLDPAKISACIYSNEDINGYYQTIIITFENTDEAEKFFKKFPEAFVVEGDDLKKAEGKEKDYSYNYILSDLASHSFLDSIYIDGDTVMIIRCYVEYTFLVEDIYKEFDIVSPFD